MHTMNARILSIHIITFINTFHGSIVDVVSVSLRIRPNKESVIMAESSAPTKPFATRHFRTYWLFYDNNSIVIRRIVLRVLCASKFAKLELSRNRTTRPLTNVAASGSRVCQTNIFVHTDGQDRNRGVPTLNWIMAPETKPCTLPATLKFLGRHCLSARSSQAVRDNI